MQLLRFKSAMLTFSVRPTLILPKLTVRPMQTEKNQYNFTFIHSLYIFFNNLYPNRSPEIRPTHKRPTPARSIPIHRTPVRSTTARPRAAVRPTARPTSTRRSPARNAHPTLARPSARRPASSTPAARQPDARRSFIGHFLSAILLTSLPFVASA